MSCSTALLGSAAYSFLVVLRFFDTRIPMNIAWLKDDRDLSQAFLGWTAFRFSDWQWPLGMSPSHRLPGRDAAADQPRTATLLSDSVETAFRYCLTPFSFRGGGCSFVDISFLRASCKKVDEYSLVRL